MTLFLMPSTADIGIDDLLVMPSAEYFRIPHAP